MRLLSAAYFLCLLFFHNTSMADSFDILAGLYDISAKTSTAEGNASNLGAYSIGYSHNLNPQVTLNAGYSLIMSGTIGGDLSFGFDMGATYYPITPSNTSVSESGLSTMVINHKYRPFIGLSFHQRQYQSVKSNYAGFGLNLGSTYDINKKYDLKALFRYITLTGPQTSTAQEMVILIGVNFSLSNH